MSLLGIMGGSFDPVHLGHLQMAESAMAELKLDGVIWIPVGDPPHKSHLAPACYRLKMIELAIQGYPKFQVSDIEIQRKLTTYTVDTLKTLHKQYANQEYVYIIGADTLFHLETWHTFELVPPLLKAMAVVPRPGISKNQIFEQIDFLQKKYVLRFDLIHNIGPDISSTDIRFAVERGLPIDHLVPEKVSAYIKRHGLYRSKMLSELMRTLTADRYQHTLGVERTAKKLAKLNGIDPDKAQIAALLHDCAKCMPEKDMKILLQNHDLLPRHKANQTRTLMHATAGMILAHEKYGIADPDILSAIRWHTTGRSGMSELEKLVYLADVIEPNRRPFPSLPAIRAATYRSLDQGMKLAAERTLQYLDNKGVLPDPHTLELLIDYQNQEGK